jgi:hypothetical protein
MALAGCLYTGLHTGDSNERVPSREHVLAESFGADLCLPDEMVCKACNNSLNTHVDQPMQRFAQPLLNLFRVAGGKHGTRPNRVLVQVEAGGEVVPGKLSSDGSLEIVPGPATELPVENAVGELVWQFRAPTKEQALAWAEARRAEGYSWDHEELRITEVNGATLRGISIQGPQQIPYRATAKTALNYLAFRVPDYARDPSLDSLKRFIKHGLGPWFTGITTLCASELDSGQIPTGLAPVHRVAVGADGTRLIMSVCFFERLAFQINVSGALASMNFHLEHEFRVDMGGNRIIDYWGLHPKALLVVCAGDCEGSLDSRIVRTDGPPAPGHVYAHEIRAQDRWNRCEECSGAARPSPPTEAEVHKCHLGLIEPPP